MESMQFKVLFNNSFCSSTVLRNHVLPCWVSAMGMLPDELASELLHVPTCLTCVRQARLHPTFRRGAQSCVSGP